MQFVGVSAQPWLGNTPMVLPRFGVWPSVGQFLTFMKSLWFIKEN
jgi:hypothetical protein